MVRRKEHNSEIRDGRNIEKGEERSKVIRTVTRRGMYGVREKEERERRI